MHNSHYKVPKHLHTTMSTTVTMRTSKPTPKDYRTVGGMFEEFWYIMFLLQRNYQLVQELNKTKGNIQSVRSDFSFPLFVFKIGLYSKI